MDIHLKSLRAIGHLDLRATHTEKRATDGGHQSSKPARATAKLRFGVLHPQLAA